MDDPGRHGLYLRGFLTSEEQVRYEAAIADQPMLAAELRARLADGTAWDAEMVRRAAGMLAVVEAFAVPRRTISPVRVDLLPPESLSFGTGGEPRVAEEKSVSEIVHTILVTALTSGAEQIEILPGDESVNVWVDSAVERRQMLRLASGVHSPLMSRIRSLCGLAVAEPTPQQTGRIPLHYNGRNYDVEVTFEPTSRGEAVTLTLRSRED